MTPKLIPISLLMKFLGGFAPGATLMHLWKSQLADSAGWY